MSTQLKEKEAPLSLRARAISDGIIDESAHEQLLADLAGYTRTAGIPEHFVWTSITKYCDKDEIDYVMDLKKSLAECTGETNGMVYLGAIAKAPVNERMMSIAGVCLRNYINAKVMTVQAVLDAMKTGDLPNNVSVLLIPNFFDVECHIAKWQISDLLGMLYQRQQEGKHTVVHVTSKEDLEKGYGNSFNKHLFGGKFVVIQ